MWLFLPYGFFSICQHPDDRRKMFVRARRKEHLLYAQERCEELRGLEIREQPASDYRWRIIASRDQVLDFMACSMRDTETDNFKDSAHALEGDAALPDHHQYTSMLHRVWSEHFKLQRR